MNSRRAPVSEIYASVQGEGPYTGQRQIFLRLAGCPLRCRYCDTPDSLVAKGHPVMDVGAVVEKIDQIRRTNKNVKMVSVTGGEPLVHHHFLEQLLPRLKKQHLGIYLETAGIHPDALRKIGRWVDVISMDIKMPSAIGLRTWRRHRDFLRVAKKKVFAKVVLEPETSMAEFAQAVKMMAAEAPSQWLVIQPATPISQDKKGPSIEQIANAYAFAAKKLKKVLVMPQQHKLWRVR